METMDICSDDEPAPFASPFYPACTCDFKCEGDAQCRFTGTSSICKPSCMDVSDCPSLGTNKTSCPDGGGYCTVFCTVDDECPKGYECIEGIECQVPR